MDISSIFSKTIEDLSVDELKKRKMELRKKIEDLKIEIRKIDSEIKILFEKALENVTPIRERFSFKELMNKKIMMLKVQKDLEKELRAISNLLIIKEHEEDLKSAGVWDKLKNLKLEEFKDWLILKDLETMDRDELISSIIEVTSMEMDVDYEENLNENYLNEILDAIRAVKEGIIELEDIEDIMEKRKEHEN